ncbi:MAG: alpha-glucosidase [Pseudomonadota bacterium]
MSTPASESLGVEWWRGATIYQIYPRSFADSNNDGVGDLKGITSRLDHVASLGVDGIWLSPFFTSPMADFGYDVSDYCDVDPIFGTLSDFDAMIDRAHALDLKVIIDQVYCHTSDRHAWFAESRQSQENGKEDWYVWADCRPDGTPPTNWLSVFGGPAWTWDGRRRQFYLHHFLKEQPTLNLHNPEVVEALIEAGKFWINRGVDGFRLDALNMGMHDLDMRDNPPLDNSGSADRPFDMQKHTYTLSHPKMEDVVEQFAAAFRSSGGDDFFTVAELGGAEPHRVMQAYTRGDDRLSTAYSFDLIGASSVSGDYMRDTLSKWSNDPSTGYPAWALSNHDCVRVASRWGIGDDLDANARLFALLHASFSGVTFLYQGEELGLPQAEIPFERLVDPEGIANWPTSQGRDGARTPMPWHAGQPFGGFSEIEPWLPVNDSHIQLAVDTQELDPASMLAFTREVVATRRESRTLRLGEYSVSPAPDNVLVVNRILEGDEWLCVYNFSDTPSDWPSQLGEGFAIMLAANLATELGVPPETLPPLGGFIAQKKPVS